MEQGCQGAPTYSTNYVHFLHSGIKTKVCMPQHGAYQPLYGTDFISAQLRGLVLRKPGVLCEAECSASSVNTAAWQGTLGHSEAGLVPHLEPSTSLPGDSFYLVRVGSQRSCCLSLQSRGWESQSPLSSCLYPMHTHITVVSVLLSVRDAVTSRVSIHLH